MLWIILFPAVLFFSLLPFSIFTALYCGGLERGIKFWNSNSPREWVGDFSNPDAEVPGGKETPLGTP